jgi:CO/xanthine dehydrogenase Mo-binding subunit
VTAGVDARTAPPAVPVAPVGPPGELVRTGETFRVVGTSISHRDFEQKVRGELSYADDWRMPGMLYGRIVRAQLPSALIERIDRSGALAIPGVHAVLTAADVPRNAITEEASGLGMDPIVQPVLAADRVRYQGEPVAVVAAETAAAAEDAADRVLVDYRDHPGVFDPEAALAPDAPLVHRQGNRLVEWRLERGDPDEALRTADAVVEGEYRTQFVDHAYMEPEAGVGWIDGDGVVTLRVATQVIEHAREIAQILGVPHTKVRVIGTYMGGGFGGKEDMTIEPYLALLVWATRRPVKMVWSRQESLLARQKRHPFTMYYRTGVMSDGRIVGETVRIVGDAGAYPLLSPRVLFAGAVTAAGPYDVPNVRVESTAVFTNNVPTSAMRGFGAMQVVFGYESQMDRLADQLGLSRTEIRERNFIKKGGQLPTHEQLDTYVAVRETLQTALEALDEEAGSGDAALDGGDTNAHYLVGRGFACGIQPYGRSRFFADRASCWMGLERDGSAVVRIGVTDLGAGQAASLAQITAEVLGVHPDRISVHIADTALTPLSGGTFGTRQLYMSGNAVLKTARELRDKLAPVATSLLGVDDPAELEFADDRVAVRGGADRFLSLAELSGAAEERGVMPFHLSTFEAETGHFDVRTGRGQTFPDFTFGTHAADVAVDLETGQIRILRYVACHDVGRMINPQRVEGQIQGGAVQGIGYALSEEIRIVEGIPESSLFADYLMPTSADVPDVRAIPLEIGLGKGPFGARGIGEPPIAPPAAVLANAVADAIGVRITELPITPERVLAALRERRGVGADRERGGPTPA